MDVLEAIRSRHSVRVFKSKPIERETLLSILEAALQAPSWTNSQPWEVFVAGGDPLERLRQGYAERFAAGATPQPDIPGVPGWPPDVQQRVAALMAARSSLLGLDLSNPEDKKVFAAPNYRFFGAPIVVFLCLDRSLSGWPLFDLGSFATTLMLAAQEFGVASVPAFSLAVYPDLVRSELSIPDHLALALGVALGYPDDTALLNTFRSTRRDLEDVVRFRGV